MGDEIVGPPAERTFQSWATLAAVLGSGDLNGWCFRGLPNEAHAPLSSLERLLIDSKVDPGEWALREEGAISFFMERARLHLPEVPSSDDLIGWLAMMQHYGAPTRLVDWTVSPFVACFFAFERMDDAAPGGALWALNARSCRSVLGTMWPGGRSPLALRPTVLDGGVVQVGAVIPVEPDVMQEENGLLRSLIAKQAPWPLPLAILQPDRRMAAQQACFVCSGKLDKVSPVATLMQPAPWAEIEARFEGVSRVGRWFAAGEGLVLHPGKREGEIEVKRDLEIPGRVVQKIRLPRAWRAEALRSLARMNITADSLFPGLDGLGRATKLYLETSAPASMREYLGL